MILHFLSRRLRHNHHRIVAQSAFRPAFFCSSFHGRNHLPQTEEELHQWHIKTRKVLLFIRTYKHYGHLIADIDPLKMRKIPELHKWTHGSRRRERPYFGDVNLLNLHRFVTEEIILQGFEKEDLHRQFYIGEDLTIGPLATLSEIVGECKRLFCGSIGAEYQHLNDREACKWIRRKLEDASAVEVALPEKEQILQELVQAETFEKFLGKRFSGAKRFSIEGGESLIPGLNMIMKQASDLGVEVVHMGMAHRGRLNVLANVLQQPLHSIFSQFQSYLPDDPEFPNNSNDVRYHLGTSSSLKLQNGKTLQVTLAANPSHLEAVNSVVLGETRASQIRMEDHDGSLVMPLLLHGDAAMFQGSVREAFGFSSLEEYKTGGCVHVIVNNQIGFTTLPKEADSAIYCSDVAKISNTPVYHVNGDDPEAVLKVMQMAVSYRQEFKRDVVVDLVTYRRHGHNEQDSPEITAPLMYRHIHNHPSVIHLYSRVISDGGSSLRSHLEHNAPSLTSEKQQQYELELTEALVESTENPESHWDSQWYSSEPCPADEQPALAIVRTGIALAQLQSIGSSLFSTPTLFSVHKKVSVIMNNRLRAVETGDRVDWGTAEALAIGSLLLEGHEVRLSGQDCERGTFNHRHAVLYDQSQAFREYPMIHIPLEELCVDHHDRKNGPVVGRFRISNSPLSEEGALAFEYGYSLQNQNGLTIWEAQFGDFANGAQVIIDTFITSGEQKWHRSSGLVLLLPHGFEGQGPDHSSARMERFLIQSNEDSDIYYDHESDAARDAAINIRIVQPTTPAQYFHVLRRQIALRSRKPLIIFSPKYLLHHRPCHSDLSDMSEGTSFVPVLGPHPDDIEHMLPDADIRKLLLCSGKIYWRLIHPLRARGLNDIATVRLEQLSPFPFHDVAKWIEKYPRAEICYVQEEPKNMGAWLYLRPRFDAIFKEVGLDQVKTVQYIGRPADASPATGQFEVHQMEMKHLIAEALK